MLIREKTSKKLPVRLVLVPVPVGNSNIIGTSQLDSPGSKSSNNDLRLDIGDRVWISFKVQENKTGIIAFIGNVGDKSNYAGIILDEPTGKNDETIGVELGTSLVKRITVFSST